MRQLTREERGRYLKGRPDRERRLGREPGDPKTRRTVQAYRGIYGAVGGEPRRGADEHLIGVHIAFRGGRRRVPTRNIFIECP
jgi:hypothetical protein